MTIGRAVRIVRQLSGMTFKGLGADLGVSAGYLCNVEAGVKPGNQELLRNVSEALSVPIEVLQLLSLDNDKLRNVTQEDCEAIGAAVVDLILKRKYATT